MGYWSAKKERSKRRIHHGGNSNVKNTQFEVEDMNEIWNKIRQEWMKQLE